jgi:hypothetical protein
MSRIIKSIVNSCLYTPGKKLKILCIGEGKLLEEIKQGSEHSITVLNDSEKKIEGFYNIKTESLYESLFYCFDLIISLDPIKNLAKIDTVASKFKIPVLLVHDKADFKKELVFQIAGDLSSKFFNIASSEKIKDSLHLYNIKLISDLTWDGHFNDILTRNT